MKREVCECAPTPVRERVLCENRPVRRVVAPIKPRNMEGHPFPDPHLRAYIPLNSEMPKIPGFTRPGILFESYPLFDPEIRTTPPDLTKLVPYSQLLQN